YYLEKDIGIQHYKQDPSLSDVELAMIQAWADNGAPEGNRADLPPALVWADGDEGRVRRDVIVRSEPIVVAGDDPGGWGEIASMRIPVETDRYVKAVEVREVNDVGTGEEGRQTVGGKYVVHHMMWCTTYFPPTVCRPS